MSEGAVAKAYRRAWELGLGEEAQYYDHAPKCDPQECKV
jgi:hypothetical protein